MIKYFSFAPGIPWEVSKNGILNPKISNEVWNSVLVNKDVVILVDGGLWESYLSLMFAEFINLKFPQKKIFWAGREASQPLMKWQGLGKFIKFPLHLAKIYTTPIFLDAANYLYFNVLRNYLITKNINGKKITQKNKCSVEQIFANTTLPVWDNTIVPKFRREHDFATWCKVHNLNLKNKFVCIFPYQNISMHKINCLGWGAQEIKSLAAILHSVGINTLVFSNFHQLYQNRFITVVPNKIEYIFTCLEQATAILSEEVDFLLLGLILGNATLFSKPLTKELELHKNATYLNKNNFIYYDFSFTPKQILNLMEEGYVAES